MRSLVSYYTEARKAGYYAKHAYSVARTLVRWDELEYMGLVKIEAKVDIEPYDPGDCEDGYTNQFGRRVSAEESKKELWELIERTGVWGVCGSAKIDGEWQHTDSVWGCAGYENVLDWRENWYVPDIMQSTMDALEASWSDSDCAYA